MAQAKALRDLGELLDEPVVDALFDEDAAAGDAHLAGMEHRGAVQGAAHRAVEVRIGEDDVRALAAQLQPDLLQRVGGHAHDLFTGARVARERDHVDVGVLNQLGPRCAARADHEVHDALRELGDVVDHLHELGRRPGVTLDGLMITALPAASAGASERVSSESAMFQGTMMETTPIGSRMQDRQRVRREHRRAAVDVARQAA